MNYWMNIVSFKKVKFKQTQLISKYLAQKKLKQEEFGDFSIYRNI